MTKLILLSAGHSNVPGRDQGASGNGYIEGHLSVEFRQLVAGSLVRLGIKPVMDGNNSILAESLNFFRKLRNAENAICLDIHWNSGPIAATGTETFIPTNYTKEESQLAEDISTVVSSILGIQKRGPRGVKTEIESHHTKLGWMTLNGTNVLMEVCFITNLMDMEKYQAYKFKLASIIAQVLFNYANGLSRWANINIPSQAQNNLETVSTTTNIYTVVSGDTLTKIASKCLTTVEKIMKDNKLSDDKIYVSQTLIV